MINSEEALKEINKAIKAIDVFTAEY